MSRIFHNEIQYFRKTKGFLVLSVFLFLIFVLFGVELFQQAWDKDLHSFTKKVNPDFVKAFSVILLFMLYVFISAFKLKLEVRISEKSISYRLAPLVKNKVINKDAIGSFEIRKGQRIRKYKGSAFRKIFGMRRNAFMIKGDHAVFLSLTDGKGILLGTQYPERLIKAIRKLVEKR